VCNELILAKHLTPCAHPEHHPDVLKLTLIQRQDLYKLAFYSLYGKDANLSKSNSYISVYDHYNRLKKARMRSDVVDAATTVLNAAPTAATATTAATAATAADVAGDAFIPIADVAASPKENAPKKRKLSTTKNPNKKAKKSDLTAADA
jgi:hypothetical protein